MDRKLLIGIIVVIVAVVATLGYILFLGSGSTVAIECVTDEDCAMSLCDCACHEFGETPEEQEGILCGKNCLDLIGVSGCVCENNKCMESTV